ncbi:MAG: pyridoxine 5'-phosphate synthase [Planctomycetota bacterium]
MIHLGVNIDHVATVRQARGTVEPDPVEAAVLAELGGADGITVHLREDRRHIQERDVRLLRQTLKGTLNLEMAVDEGILDIALDLRPNAACLVPEHRAEVTTEGGLRLDREDASLRHTVDALRQAGVLVSLFIDPEPDAVRTAASIGAEAVELHTGAWANAWLAVQAMTGPAAAVDAELVRLERAAAVAAEAGIRLHAGHGITYRNVRELLHLPLLRELNIGHSIISRAVLVGMRQAVADMAALITYATH